MKPQSRIFNTMQWTNFNSLLKDSNKNNTKAPAFAHFLMFVFFFVSILIIFNSGLYFLKEFFEECEKLSFNGCHVVDS